MKADEQPIVVEEEYKVSVDALWEAIMEIELMRKWCFDKIPEFDPVIGFKTEFVVESGGRKFTHLWEICEIVPRKKISYKWKYREYPGDSIVTFELFPGKGFVKLRLTDRVLEDFPDDIEEFMRESGLEGWSYFIKKRLKEYLEEIS